VYQHKYEWFVKLNGKEYPFMEGMVVGGWPKALKRNTLRQGRGRGFDVNPYTTTTYDNHKNFLFYAILPVDKPIILCRIIVSPQTENSNV
jgi:hypothetical protein